MAMIIGQHNIRAFVVVLQECPDRTECIQNHFRQIGLQAENFNGISAAVSGLRTEHCYEVDAPGSGWNIGPRPVANWLSFYMLWTAMLYMPDEYFLTLEWDAEFQPNWRERTEAALANVPKDFDLLLLGSCCATDKNGTLVGGEVFDVRYPQCGHATIVAKKALPIMLHSQRKVYANMDISLKFHTFPMLKVYTVLPTIATQFNTNLVP